jgi:predicted RNase H-like HicB family nuclease
MKIYTYIVEKCPDTGYFVGYVPGFPSAHSQGETLDELHANMQEVIGMLTGDSKSELKPAQSKF